MINKTLLLLLLFVACQYMSSSEIKVPSQKFPVPKITMQTKSHNLNFNVLSSVVDSSGDEVWVSFDSDNYFYVKTWFE